MPSGLPSGGQVHLGVGHGAVDGVGAERTHHQIDTFRPCLESMRVFASPSFSPFFVFGIYAV
ncbi:hypothetical protein B005_1234 [Nocardiopsis alba ATCC BAA-2165]|uniref:Uncharacterized protein n=1 Tax=Nocardiopsis alba (strain ATCC BAA-2165 / BE74) TaxID=1205910 RepID=J7L661_NOCAA|nr:hypothetical protein B005_1234 [Nocardiopsis alba ATCC BAA-2165]